MKLSFKLTLFCLFLFVYQSGAQVFEVDTLQYYGDSKKMVDFVILSDGYTQSQLGKFEEDAKKFRDYLFSQSPYSHYKQYFNVYLIKVPSVESGVKHANNANDCPKGVKEIPASNPDNYFGSSFDNSGLHRLVVAHNYKAIKEVLRINFPAYDQTIILANSPHYGGSGGEFPTATVNTASNDIAIHELGHSFAALADEYWPGLQFQSENANRSQYISPDKVTWKKWIGTNGIGIYSYGGTAPKSVWFRPHEFCKMQYLIAPFCSVCSQAIIEKIHSLTNPITKILPDTVQPIAVDSIKLFRVKLAKPDPNTLKVEWHLNGILTAWNIDSIRIDPALLKVGQNRISVTVSDTTDLVRSDTNTQYKAQWTIINDSIKIIKSPEVRWGDSIQTCYGSAAALSVKNPKAGINYKWYTGPLEKTSVSSGINLITAPIYKETIFYLESEWNNVTSSRTPVTVKVLPEINAPEEFIIEKKSDSVKISVANPKPDLNYQWYLSETDLKPLAGYGDPELQGIKIEQDGIVLKVRAPKRDTYYYVTAVSKLSSCRSIKKKVYVKAESVQ